MQAPPQSVDVVLGQSVTQRPLAHFSPPVQICPQRPQFLTSALNLTQAPLQSTEPAGHIQPPWTQLFPLGQALLQTPQCWLFWSRFWQASLQRALPSGQRHVPLRQRWPWAQALSSAQGANTTPPQASGITVIPSQTQNSRTGAAQTPRKKTDAGIFRRIMIHSFLSLRVVEITGKPTRRWRCQRR